jgi:hypothetical protein
VGRSPWRSAAARWAVVALVGGALCTVCDHLHVVGGVLYYPHPDVWQQAFWVPFLFIGASLAMPAGVAPFRQLARQLPPPSMRALVVASLLFVAAYAFTAAAGDWPNVVLLVLGTSWLIRVSMGVPRWLILYSLAVALVGAGLEAVLSSTGAFYYRHPDFLGVTRWLPALYLHAGLLAGPVRRMLDA